MRSILAVLFVCFAVSTADAQIAEIDKFTGNTVFMAIQCDVGRLGSVAKAAKLDPGMKAQIKYAYTVDKSAKVEASLGVKVVKWILEGPSVSAAATWARTEEDSLEGPFNINQGNLKACGKKNLPRIPVGIYDCFKDSMQPIASGFVKSCKRKRIVAGNLTANGTIKWLVFEFEPKGTFDIKATYDIDVSAPAKDDKKTGS